MDWERTKKRKRLGITVKCAECGTWYYHEYNTEYHCPGCGGYVVDDWKSSIRIGKLGMGA